MGRARKGFVILLVLGVALLGLDYTQRWIYLHRLPELPKQIEVGEGGALTRSILVGGAGLDEAERATVVRDLQLASESIPRAYSGRHQIRILHPDQLEFTTESFLQELKSSSDCQRLLIYLTGHGGGFNFGATSRFNVKTETILEALAEVECDEILLVVDCCWAGVFHQKMDDVEMRTPLTLITSTDAQHPAPFPVSFLSPGSFGAMFFERLEQGEEAAFEATNRYRGRFRALYPNEIGLSGVRQHYKFVTSP